MENREHELRILQLREMATGSLLAQAVRSGLAIADVGGLFVALLGRGLIEREDGLVKREIVEPRYSDLKQEIERLLREGFDSNQIIQFARIANEHRADPAG